jgi:tetratricopeptide (TPR) repeat protein
VERQRGDSASRVDLLVAIGRQYASLDEDAKARRLLEEAYQLSRGLSEPSPRAQASCALGSAVARGADRQRAEALIEEGLRVLPNQPQFGLDRVFCLLRGSEVARGEGASEKAIERARIAQGLLASSPLRSEILDLRALMDVAESYRVAGQYRDAIPVFEQASVLMDSLGRGNTDTAGTLLNNWALALQLFGRPLEAEKLYRRAIDISRAGQSEEAVSPMLLNNYARTLRELGRLDEAAVYAERAYATAKQAGAQIVLQQSTAMRARIYRDQHDFARASAMFAEAEVMFRRNLPPGHPGFALLASDRSLLELERGNLESALRLANEALTKLEATVKSGRGGAEAIPWLLVRRSDIELRLNHPNEAAADASRALSLLQVAAQPGTFSSNLGHAYLSLGRALQARGKREEARAAFRSAAEHLQNTLGPDHPDTRSARQLAETDAQQK